MTCNGDFGRTNGLKGHPLRLLYQEAFADKSAALAAEYRFKHQSRRAKEKFLHMRGVKW